MALPTSKFKTISQLSLNKLVEMYFNFEILTDQDTAFVNTVKFIDALAHRIINKESLINGFITSVLSVSYEHLENKEVGEYQYSSNSIYDQRQAKYYNYLMIDLLNKIEFSKKFKMSSFGGIDIQDVVRGILVTSTYVNEVCEDIEEVRCLLGLALQINLKLKESSEQIEIRANLKTIRFIEGIAKLRKQLSIPDNAEKVCLETIPLEYTEEMLKFTKAMLED